MKHLLPLSIILATGLIVGGYVSNRQWPLALITLGVGALWLVGYQRRWEGLASPLFVALIILAGLGIYQGVSNQWMFLGTVAALISWDLSHFAGYLAQAEEIEAETTLRQGHLKRLQLTVILSLLL